MNTNSYFDGKDANQNPEEFISQVKELKKRGMKEVDIAKAAGYETMGDYWEDYYSACGKARFNQFRSAASTMLDNGKSEAETAIALDINKSTLRSLLNERSRDRTYTVGEIADHLRKLVDETGMADVGRNVELEFHVTRMTFAHACAILEEEGYPTYARTVALTSNPNKRTRLQVMCSPGTTLLLARKALDIIQKDRV